MDSTTQEREELEQLLQSPGWARFSAQAQKEWGTPDGGGGIFFLAAVTKAANEHADADATSQLRQIMAAQRAIHRLIAWPEEALKAAAKAEQSVNVVELGSRRGRL